MPDCIVAALERQGSILLCAVSPGSGARARVVTEDGRTFEYPVDRFLWRSTTLRVPGESGGDRAAALRALRARLGPPPRWQDLHAAVDPGVPLDPADLVPRGDDLAAAALALAAADAGPLFRLEKGRVVALTEEEAQRAAERAEAERVRRVGDAALVAALRAREGGRRRALPPEAEGSLAALLHWAAGPPSDRPEVAAAAALAEPDDGLEALDAAGLLPPDAMPPLSRRRLGDPFPEAVLREAAVLASTPDGAPHRRDLSRLPTFALDDPETVEVDDALSVDRGPGGEPLLLVHIADVVDALPCGGGVDADARRRASTIYLPERRVPMLPPDFTAARLTLAVGERRAAVTIAFRVGEGGRAEPVTAERTWVTLSERLDYGSTASGDGLPPALRPALEMAEAFRAARAAAGARVVSLPSRHVRVRDGETVLTFRGGGAGDLLVAEAMVAFNGAVAERLRAAGAAALWRAQEPPRADPPDPAHPLFPLLARRMFAPARVSPTPAPHAGLGLPCYVQATSPIRRYSDVVHQRQFVAILAGHAPPHGPEEVAALGPELFQRERDIHHAEAEREGYRLALWLTARRAEEFDGVASRTAAHGRAAAWVPALLQDCPVRWPRERGPGPVPGTALRLRPGRVAPWRGRLEFDIVEVPADG